MENFYQLSANCSNKYKYLKKLISGDIDIRKKCSKCGNFFQYDESAYENLVFEISEKGKFSDCIMYGGAPNFLIVSQNTLDIFNKESVTGFNEHIISILLKNKLTGFDIRDIKYAMNPYYTKDLHT